MRSPSNEKPRALAASRGSQDGLAGASTETIPKPFIPKAQARRPLRLPDTPRRRRLAQHLFDCGPRSVMEAVLAIGAGEPIDDVLEDFARVPAGLFTAMGAREIPAPELSTVDGGRIAGRK
jgi:hypothetical protein